MRHFIKFICSIFILWGVAFASFFYISRYWHHEPSIPAEGIVVLTGGKGRIETGLNLLKEGHAKRLLISGVHTHVKLRVLLKKEDLYLEKNIDLDHRARNTTENAYETRLWLEKNHLASLQMVTADYHLLRSLLEFHMQLQEIKIFPTAVGLKSHCTLKCWVKEFHKFMASFFRYLCTNLMI